MIGYTYLVLSSGIHSPTTHKMASRAQARFRKTFQYPDSDDDDTPEALDEEGSSHFLITLPFLLLSPSTYLSPPLPYPSPSNTQLTPTL